MDNACFRVTNHFKDRNKGDLFLTFRHEPLKLFAKPSLNSRGDDSFRLIEKWKNIVLNVCFFIFEIVFLLFFTHF